MTNGKDDVLVYNRARTDRNMHGHILTLCDHPIFKPAAADDYHAQPNLARHRYHRFS